MFSSTHKNTELKLVPAGVSRRTGRAYDAFYGCPIQGCKETAPAPDQPSLEEVKNNLKEKAVDEREYWDSRKDRELKLSAKQTAVKAAFELSAAKTSKLETDPVSTEEAIEEAKKVYKWLLEENGN